MLRLLKWCKSGVISHSYKLGLGLKPLEALGLLSLWPLSLAPSALLGTRDHLFLFKTSQTLLLQRFLGFFTSCIFSYPGIFSRSNGVKIGVELAVYSFYTTEV